MLRWASIIGSWTAVALLGATSIAGLIEADWHCVGWHWIDGILPDKCITLYSFALWPFFLGVGLTALLAAIHLIVAARQKRWGWFNALLIAPPLCYCTSAYIGGPYSSNTFLFFIICLPLIGLPNLLFSFEILNPTREPTRSFLSGKAHSGLFKWASVIGPLIGVTLLGGAGFAGFDLEPAWGCSDFDGIGPPPPECATLYTLVIWMFLLGIGLTVLWGLIHLSMTAKQNRWGWFNALLMIPLLNFFFGAYVYHGPFSGTVLLSFFSIAFIGLPNLLFGLSVLNSTPEAARAAPAGEAS